MGKENIKFFFFIKEKDRKYETWTGGFEKQQAGGIGIKSDFLTGHVWVILWECDSFL